MEDRFSKVKVIVSEIDGIITEHLTAFDPLGIPIFKQYNMKDFEAINEIKKAFTFIFLSSDAAINYKVCRDRNIPFYHAQRSKGKELFSIREKYSITPDEIIYIGNTYSDLECIKLIPLSICPADSVKEVRTASAIILDNPSGFGVLCEVYELLKPEIIRRSTLDN